MSFPAKLTNQNARAIIIIYIIFKVVHILANLFFEGVEIFNLCYCCIFHQTFFIKYVEQKSVASWVALVACIAGNCLCGFCFLLIK